MLRRAAEVIKQLGHPDRLRIVEVLGRGERSVRELCARCGLEQAICSQHLSRLRRHRIVAARRVPPRVFYRVIEPMVRAILAGLRKGSGRWDR
jgi:ArsR family transcriptional regulator